MSQAGKFRIAQSRAAGVGGSTGWAVGYRFLAREQPMRLPVLGLDPAGVFIDSRMLIFYICLVVNFGLVAESECHARLGEETVRI